MAKSNFGVWGPGVPSRWWRWTPPGRRRMRRLLEDLLRASEGTLASPEHLAELRNQLRRYGGAWMPISATLPDVTAPVAVSLTAEERTFLRHGVAEWWGPARCTDAFAVAMGFQSREHLHDDIARLRDALDAETPMLPEDWRRLLLAVEVVFASDVVGSGLDWAITTEFSDGDSIALLRGIQRKMPRWRSSFQFTTSEGGHTSVLDAERPEADGG